MVTLLLSLWLTLLQCINAQHPAYQCSHGACHVTSNAFKQRINESEIYYSKTHGAAQEIEEYHFHIYFFQNNNDSVSAATWMQQQLIEKVMSHEFLVVLTGVNSSVLPDLDESEVPYFNMHPIGPHPCGSFEVWTPAQYLEKAMSWLMMNRGELTVLLHPLTTNEIEDHYARAMWLGPPYRLDFTQLDAEGGDPPQYAELQLGYNYNANSKYAPQNWLKS